MPDDAAYDYVIAGGGTGGSVLAGRLSEDPSVRVLLLEAGRSDRHPFIHMPAGFPRLKGGPYQWEYRSVPQKHSNGRRIPLPQGRGLGGGGSINSQVFTRGVAEDYDGWAEDYGCEGWSADEVYKYFVRSESNCRLSGPHHGTRAPRRLGPPASAQALGGLRAGGPGVRAALQQRLQRRGAARRRLLPDHHQERPPVQRGRRLSEARAQAAQSHCPRQCDRLQGDHQERPRRRHPGDRRRQSREPTVPGARCSSPAALSVRPSCCSFQASATRQTLPPPASTSSMPCPGSGRTCRTTWTWTSSTNSPTTTAWTGSIACARRPSWPASSTWPSARDRSRPTSSRPVASAMPTRMRRPRTCSSTSCPRRGRSRA